MNINEFSIRLRNEVNQFFCAGRNESAAFLIWYLNNFFRIDKQEAIGSVCDNRNDKGIDGIYVDDDEEEIYLFQSKFSPSNEKAQGDNDLRNFIGAKQWFSNEEAVCKLLRSTAHPDLKSLVEGLKINEKISAGYTIYMQFITNKIFDTNAKEFLNLKTEELAGCDLNDLFQRYTYIAEKEIQTEVKTLQLSNDSKISYPLPTGILANVYAIPVKELLKLDGIQDRTLFYKNVRYGLGKTRVNKEIRKTILNTSEHQYVFLYHNGITIICDTLDEISSNQLTIKNYSVINGCQSILTFYENRDEISEDMFVLTKIIKLKADSPLTQQITYFTNNQNAISLKDLKSNDRVQIGIQNEFKRLFDNTVLYMIKSGESTEGYNIVIEIDFAAQLIEAFYLKSPHTTHLKSNLFGERYSKIFSRHISAANIFLAYIVYEMIEENISVLSNEQIRDYGLAKFFFTYLIGEVLRSDIKGEQVLSDPDEFITAKQTNFVNSIEKLWRLLAPEINAFIDEYTKDNGNFFDYKNIFKNSEFVEKMCRRIKTDHQKILVRHPEDSFDKIYQSLEGN